MGYKICQSSTAGGSFGFVLEDAMDPVEGIEEGSSETRYIVLFASTTLSRIV